MAMIVTFFKPILAIEVLVSPYCSYPTIRRTNNCNWLPFNQNRFRIKVNFFWSFDENCATLIKTLKISLPFMNLFGNKRPLFLSCLVIVPIVRSLSNHFVQFVEFNSSACAARNLMSEIAVDWVSKSPKRTIESSCGTKTLE